MSLLEFLLFAVISSAAVLSIPVLKSEDVVMKSWADHNETTLFKESNSTSSDVIGEHPFLRAKRAVTDNCTVPTNWPTQIAELNTYLNATLFMSLYPQQPNFTPLPTGQPTTCPSYTGSWWPGTVDNLRATCPWVYEDFDQGESSYPRYVRQARCLCTGCLGSNAYSCQYLRQEITIFKRGACKNGLAVMNKMPLVITVGCYCAPPQSQTQVPVADYTITS